MSVPQNEAAVAEPCGYVYEQDVSSSLAVTSWVKEEWRKKVWKEREEEVKRPRERQDRSPRRGEKGGRKSPGPPSSNETPRENTP